jgi:hypothetical protein
MGEARRRHWREEKCIQGFGEEICRKSTIRRPRHRWVLNIKIDLQEIGWERMNWICLTQDRDD